MDIVIRGLGFNVPSRVLTNAELEIMVETSDEWILTRTGIRERHIIAEGEASSDLAIPAVEHALKEAGFTAKDVTHVVVATFTPDFVCPNCATTLANKMGMNGVMAIDVNAACSGYLNAMQVGRGLVCLVENAVVLVVAVDALTSRTNWEDRTTCVLFGDGAGAAVLTRTTGADDEGLILDMEFRCDGNVGDHLTVIGGGSRHPYRAGDVVGPEYFVQMNGREVFKHAVRNMDAICSKVLSNCGKTLDDVDIFIPHQANLRIIEALGDRMGVPREKVFVNVDRYGNTSAASVAIALAEARQLGRIKRGDLALLTTFGGGLTWGAGLVQF
ncbi:putative 3-oxoacyl-(acyl-carrier-protein) synthase III [Megalodesulfovibrio gigas DSM 1382 = ATCC 19364]|uniref:Beta-ketoacyl-[acyl-carrier-protein] synthase III n=2 Tax=Megalodesulfovibrio gigas TaxID=879 RepID=T2GCR7_MEGG1|nr:putative 3-oxoacyl-(acyl-carrier-protein) synthase III [Megalodesulfovibrio gigas DSM 1382 = ATCC 19364]